LEKVIGVLLRIALILGFLMLIPLPVSYYFNEPLTVRFAFLIPALIIIIGSLALSILVPLSRELSITEAYVASSLGWILTASLGALPYASSGLLSYLDAFFESMSGFTTTGMTLIVDVEQTPRSILFWRALTQWVGGVGVLTFFILTFMVSGVEAWRLYSAEAREERFMVRARDAVKATWLIYVFYTVICVIALSAVGLPLFDAITHAFTALSTGGFSTRNASIAGFNNPAAEAVLVVFMVIGGINFRIHHLILTGRFKRAFRSSELKLFILLIALTSLIVLASLMDTGLSFPEALRKALFQVVSIVTTTGYVTTDITNWHPLPKATLLILMFIGGGLCSTAGGIKVLRLLIAVKLASRELVKTVLPPGTIKPVMVDGRTLPDEDTLRTLSFLILYTLSIVVVTLIVASSGYGITEATSIALSAQGNVGPTLASTYGIHLWTPPYVKLTLTIAMWIGRLELFPVLILPSKTTWRHLIG